MDDREEEKHTDQYKRPKNQLSPMVQEIIKSIYEILGGKKEKDKKWGQKKD